MLLMPAIVLAGLLAIVTPSSGLHASDYPNRPLRIVVVNAAGGTTDSAARLLADRMKERLGQPVIVENKAGANGALAADFVAKSAPDGYTLLFATSGAMAINPVLDPNLSYKPVQDFVPISMVVSNTLALVVGPKSGGLETVRDFINAARTAPGTISIGTTGAGGPAQIGIDLIEDAAKVKLLPVPYRGTANLMPDLLSGELNGIIGDISGILPQVKTGSLRALAVLSSERSSHLPNVPTFIEAGFPSVELTNWNVLLAPAKTPPQIVAVLNAAVTGALSEASVRRQFLESGAPATPTSSQEAYQKMSDELNRMRKVIKSRRE